MTLEEYFGEWMRVIDKRSLEEVLNKLGPEYKRKPICPAQSKMFRAFELCPYNDLKVVMLGQDPYPQKGVATGILFGNDKEVAEENLSPSLQVIEVEHPAYFARTNTKMPYEVFRNVSNLVKGIYGVPIEWYKEY